ncbi:MAG: hypothetical protein KAH31_03340 [Candidatus Sabulitectum sp.]|nr:hypothetical protein [Candidatus Sabulitectum sp.]
MNRCIRYIFLLLFVSARISAEALILYTSDAGESWDREESNTLFCLNDVAISITTGIAISVGDNGTILRRGEDETWADVSPEGFTADLYSVAVGVSGMMACGEDGALLSSFDGGTGWRILDNFQHSGIDLYSVNFDPTHPNSFLIVGEDGFIYSSEDGLVETESSSDYVASCGTLCNGFPDLIVERDGRAYRIQSENNFIIDNTILSGATEIVTGGSRYTVVGERGSIYRLLPQNEWECIAPITEENLNDVAYIMWGQTLCAVGKNGTVLISEDNGLTWEISNPETSRDLNAVAGNGAGIACIVGSSVMSGMVNFFTTSEVSD